MKRFLSFLLALLIVTTSLTAFGCGLKEEEKAEPISLLDENGEAAYVIYRAADASQVEKNGSTTLRELLAEKLTVRFQLTTDEAENLVEGKGEILVGDTARELSQTAKAGITETQFRFLCKNGSVAIVAGTDELLELAAETFVKEFVSDGTVQVPSNLDRTWECEQSIAYHEVKNPINDEGDDPFVTYHNGTYYYCWSGGGGVMISSAESIDKISKSGGVVAYKAPETGMYSKEYWAPELFYIDGAWYIYVAADDGNDANHRMHVMKCENEDPTAKANSFEYVGKITDPSDKWAIDGTVLFVEDEMYFVWSGWDGDNDFGSQKLFIAHMSNPWTIDSNRVKISYPSNSWEGPLNEGPIAVYNGDDIYIVYSGNGSWTGDYCLGYLRLKDGQDPMKVKSWEKSTTPILQRNNVAKGPGHCSVATASDGSQWVIYHANLPEEPDGWEGRSVWIQKLQFTDAGKIKLMKNAKTVEFPGAAEWTIKEDIID